VNVVEAIELIVPSTPLPLVCITLSRKARNCAIAFFYFTLGGVLDGFLGRVGCVLDELGDFDGVAEKYGRHLRDVVDGAGTAAQIAAVHIGETCFASGTNLQREAHVARADAFDIAALLDHGEQDVVAFVEERKFVADFFELQCDGLRILHLCHGGVSVVGFEVARAGLPVPRVNCEAVISLGARHAVPECGVGTG
jgi:hypothetical protein